MNFKICFQSNVYVGQFTASLPQFYLYFMLHLALKTFNLSLTTFKITQAWSNSNNVQKKKKLDWEMKMQWNMNLVLCWRLRLELSKCKLKLSRYQFSLTFNELASQITELITVILQIRVTLLLYSGGSFNGYCSPPSLKKNW